MLWCEEPQSVFVHSLKLAHHTFFNLWEEVCVVEGCLKHVKVFRLLYCKILILVYYKSCVKLRCAVCRFFSCQLMRNFALTQPIWALEIAKNKYIQRPTFDFRFYFVLWNIYPLFPVVNWSNSFPANRVNSFLWHSHGFWGVHSLWGLCDSNGGK